MGITKDKETIALPVSLFFQKHKKWAFTKQCLQIIVWFYYRCLFSSYTLSVNKFCIALYASHETIQIFKIRILINLDFLIELINNKKLIQFETKKKLILKILSSIIIIALRKFFFSQFSLKKQI